jgi:nicotinamidase-related amidase
MTTALLIVDIQKEYFPGGKNPLVEPIQAAENACRLLEAFRYASLPVVYIQHIATRQGATSFLPGTPGIEIHPLIQPREGETVIQKHYPNSFRETILLEHLRTLGTNKLVICGMQTHMCVDAGVRAAVDIGFECRVAADACATKDLAFGGQTVPAAHVHAAFLAALNSSYAKVLPTGELLADQSWINGTKSI